MYYGSASHVYTESVVVGNTTTTILSGLAPGTTYYIAAVACDNLGKKSGFSTELAYTVPASAESPPAGATPSYTAGAGSYSGLLSATNQDQSQVGSAGSFSFLVTSRGAYSGHLQMGSTRSSFSGNLDSQGQARNTLRQPTGPAMVLQLSLAGNNEINEVLGTLSDSDWVANLTGGRAQFDARSNPAPYAGRYTLIFPGQTGIPSLPAGDGFGAVNVTASGQALFAGKLADGTAVSQSTTVSAQGEWPLYLSAYSGKGMLTGWLEFAAQTNSDLAGDVTWLKPSVLSSRYYPNGFTNAFQALGSAYAPPARPEEAVLNLTNGTVTFSGGNLDGPLADAIELGLSSRVTNLGSNRLTLSFSPGTGAFSGRAEDGTTGQPMPFGGVVLQKLDAGYGALLGTDQSSQVLIGQ